MGIQAAMAHPLLRHTISKTMRRSDGIAPGTRGSGNNGNTTLTNYAMQLLRLSLWGTVLYMAVSFHNHGMAMDRMAMQAGGVSAATTGGSVWGSSDSGTASASVSQQPDESSQRELQQRLQEQSQQLQQIQSMIQTNKQVSDNLNKPMIPNGWDNKPAAATTTSTAQGASSSSSLSWHNQFNVVHVLESRFQQLQPNLLHLGQARLDLFQTFTLPSILAQTTQEFLWIIRTDPQLHPQLLTQMQDLLRDHPHIILLGTNAAWLDFNDPDYFTKAKITRDLVFSGSWDLLLDYHSASLDRVHLLTRLDTDDALYKEHMEHVQRSTYDSGMVHVTSSAASEATSLNLLAEQVPEFRAYCVDKTLEWGYFNPWDRTKTQGHVFGRDVHAKCIVAGLTYATQAGVLVSQVATGHHRVLKTYPLCSPDQDTKKSLKKKSSNEPITRNCVSMIHDNKYRYLVLRARTPTSTAMDGVIPGPSVTRSERWKKGQKYGWTFFNKNFGIPPQSIIDLRNRLQLNMKDVLQDALQGQCSRREFTCKEKSLTTLNKLLKQVEAFDQSASKNPLVKTDRTVPHSTATSRQLSNK